MKIKNSLILLIIQIVVISSLLKAQSADVDISACVAIEKILFSMKNSVPKTQVSSMLDSVLSTKPYVMMFKHYNRSWRPNHLPPAVFKRLILSLKFDGEYSVGENQRADQMIEIWKKYYNDLQLYSKILHQFQKIDLNKLINDAVSYAQSWLPPKWQIPDFYFPIIPNGGSLAFTIENTQGYDFFQMPQDTLNQIDWENFLATVSHESHHLGIHTPGVGKANTIDSLAYEFINLFIGEGTAVRFMDNSPGAYVPVLTELRKPTQESNRVQSIWGDYIADVKNIFNKVISTYESISSGKLTRDQLESEISHYWLSGYTSLVYFVGSELFGPIYVAFGKEKVFEAMQNPRKIFYLYNNAIKLKPRLLGNCTVLPDSMVRHALSIGMNKN